MKKSCLNKVALIVVVVSLCYSVAVAQKKASNKDQIRNEIESIFGERNEALKKADKEKLDKLLAPDFAVKLPNEKSLTKQEWDVLAARDIGRSDYQEEFVLESLEIKAETALVQVRNNQSYKQKFKDGTFGNIVYSAKRRETWVETFEGWKLRVVDNFAFVSATLNGKRAKAKDFSFDKLSLPDTPQQIRSEDKAILQSGKAIVFVFRAKALPDLIHLPVHLDGQEIASMRGGRYLKLQLSPGIYRFRSDKEPELTVAVKSGQLYYFEVKLVSGFPRGRGQLVTVDPQMGAQIYLVLHTLSLKAVEDKDIKDLSKIIK